MSAFTTRSTQALRSAARRAPRTAAMAVSPAYPRTFSVLARATTTTPARGLPVQVHYPFLLLLLTHSWLIYASSLCVG